MIVGKVGRNIYAVEIAVRLLGRLGVGSSACYIVRRISITHFAETIRTLDTNVKFVEDARDTIRLGVERGVSICAAEDGACGWLVDHLGVELVLADGRARAAAYEPGSH